MKNRLKLALTLGGIFLGFISTNVYASIPNNSNPTTFLGPTLQGGYTNSINNNNAWNVAAEIGVKNYRVGATLGHALSYNQRIKLSAEYLTQNITYAFFAGNTNQWVNQGAIGADYQYDLAYNYHPQVDMQAYYSHAPNKGLNTVTGSYVNASGIPTSFVNYRRIAGSNAGGISPGITIQPLAGMKTGIALNYDIVHYDNSNSPSRSANGLGATAHLEQALTKNLELGLLASVRQPFDNYQASLTWSNIPFMGKWTAGIDAAYTVGRQSLPNSYNVGLTFNYFMDQPVAHTAAATAQSVSHSDDSLASWTAQPAVYMPQVLAIADGSTPGCTSAAPVFTGTIANGIGFGTLIFNSPTQFTGSNLTYTVTSTHVSGPLGTTVTINPTTGVVTVAGILTSTTSITITAINPCGAAASSNTFTAFFT